MAPFYYAQINAQNVCFAVTQTAGEIIQDDMLRIDSYDTSLLNKIWENGVWVDPPEPEPMPELQS